MYYKITDKQAPVYKNLHVLRTRELQIEELNRKEISDKIGLEWTAFLGHSQQSTLNRTTQYSGFVFTEPEKADPKIWKKDNSSSAFIPNRRTKAGREMAKFLSNGLEASSFITVLEVLGIKYEGGSFSLPFVEIVDDAIIIYLDESHEPTATGVVEITKKEFHEIYEENRK